MKVQITRKEIDETAVILKEIREWEKLKDCLADYSPFHLAFTDGRATVKSMALTLRYESGRGIQEKFRNALRKVAQKHAPLIVEQALEALKQLIPIPLED